MDKKGGFETFQHRYRNMLETYSLEKRKKCPIRTENTVKNVQQHNRDL